MRRTFAILGTGGAAALLCYLLLVAHRIARQSAVDEARPADIIVVLGAAEYNGRPSPVLKARLDHALALYRRGLAPLIFTTGGAGGDPQFTEGQVGRDYLVQHGVPSEQIVFEGEGDTTVETLVAVGEVMRRMGLRSAILVSDGYHIYRAKSILQSQGVTVYGSPRPHTPRGSWRERWLYWRQAVGYLLWRLHIAI
ncbi:MAG: YdcF family protein [Bryobacteraceae bacterium]